MNFKKPSASVLLTYAALSIGLSVFNYYFAFILTYIILQDNFSINIFLIGIIVFIMIESLLIAEITRSKLLAVLGTTTLISWLFNNFIYAFFGLFNSYVGKYLSSTQDIFGYMTLNVFFLIFSYIGALIGLQIAAKPAKSKKRKS